MTAVSFFQRYSQRENHVTNNTLLMLRHLFRHSISKVEGLFTAIAEEELSLGLQFAQQVASSSSVPDAVISQNRLSVYVEAKLGNKVDERQIINHVKGIRDAGLAGDGAVLLCLTKGDLDERIMSRIREAARPDVRIVGVTFSQLLSEIRRLCEPHDQDLREIVDDYGAYLAHECLLSRPFEQMLAFPCGLSWRENVRYRLYYEPSVRPLKTTAAFIGVYHQKQISHVGKLLGVAILQWRKGNPVLVETEFGKVKLEQLRNAGDVAENTKYYDLKNEGGRYYFVEDFVETAFLKNSSGGMRAHRYFDLLDYVERMDAKTTTKDLALALSQKSFL